MKTAQQTLELMKNCVGIIKNNSSKIEAKQIHVAELMAKEIVAIIRIKNIKLK